MAKLHFRPYIPDPTVLFPKRIDENIAANDPDATFMRMKEDVMKNGQTKPGYNLRTDTENQFITDFGLFPDPTDTLTLIPFFHSFQHRYNRLPKIGVADSGYTARKKITGSCRRTE